MAGRKGRPARQVALGLPFLDIHARSGEFPSLNSIGENGHATPMCPTGQIVEFEVLGGVDVLSYDVFRLLNSINPSFPYYSFLTLCSPPN